VHRDKGEKRGARRLNREKEGARGLNEKRGARGLNGEKKGAGD